MHIFSVLLLGVATNLDNFIIGMSMGFQGKRIGPAKNIVIALFSGVASFICCYAASFCTSLGRIPNIMGGVLLILLGAGPLMIKRPGRREEEPGCPAVPGGPQPLSWRETLTVALALAANCLAAAFAAGMTGLSAAGVALVTGGFSLACVGLGNRIGRRGSRLLPGPWLERAACLLLILIGIWEIGV